MTITTAKRPPVVPAALLAMLLSPYCHAQWQFTPRAEVTQTYTDNANLQTRERAQSRFITEVAPGFTVNANSERLQLRADYKLTYFAYHGGRPAGTATSQSEYRAAGKASVIDELLFVDASAERRPGSISAFGPQVNNNLYARENRTNNDIWRVSPYLRHRFGPTAELTARYTRDRVDSGASAFGSSDGEGGSVDLVSGPVFDTVGWGLGYQRQDLDNELAGETSTELAHANLSYKVSRTLTLTASGGYDRYDYQATGGERTEGRNWSGGFIWTPSPRTSIRASSGKHFLGNTGALNATHRSRRTLWSLQYSDAITTTRDQFLRPAAIDTATMLDEMYRATLPDPVARQQAVAAYMLATGLPATLGEEINYLSNRFLRQKQLQGAVIMTGKRSTLMFSVHNTSRTALSTGQSDSQLLGGQFADLNDDTRQRGASSMFNYRITPRSSAHASLDIARIHSLSTGQVANNQALRVGMTRQLGNRVHGAAEVRHVRGDRGPGSGRKYYENAISATISMQL